MAAAANGINGMHVKKDSYQFDESIPDGACCCALLRNGIQQRLNLGKNVQAPTWLPFPQS